MRGLIPRLTGGSDLRESRAVFCIDPSQVPSKSRHHP